MLLAELLLGCSLLRFTLRRQRQELLEVPGVLNREVADGLPAQGPQVRSAAQALALRTMSKLLGTLLATAMRARA